jgi:hypothetical protein
VIRPLKLYNLARRFGLGDLTFAAELSWTSLQDEPFRVGMGPKQGLIHKPVKLQK